MTPPRSFRWGLSGWWMHADAIQSNCSLSKPSGPSVSRSSIHSGCMSSAVQRRIVSRPLTASRCCICSVNHTWPFTRILNTDWRHSISFVAVITPSGHGKTNCPVSWVQTMSSSEFCDAGLGRTNRPLNRSRGLPNDRCENTEEKGCRMPELWRPGGVPIWRHHGDRLRVLPKCDRTKRSRH